MKRTALRMTPTWRLPCFVMPPLTDICPVRLSPSGAISSNLAAMRTLPRKAERGVDGTGSVLALPVLTFAQLYGQHVRAFLLGARVSAAAAPP